VRIRNSRYDALTARAKREGISRSAWIDRALDAALTHGGAGEPRTAPLKAHETESAQRRASAKPPMSPAEIVAEQCIREEVERQALRKKAR
jgi:hypothetical protein